MRPLGDVRIVAVEQYGAGPFGSVQLADLGADVIKIEDPNAGGDIGRYVPPFQEGEDSLFFETFNRNKRSVSLDITNPAGRQVFEDLVRVSDVVYSNLRGDVPGRLRILYDDLKHLNPAVVCCSLTGFGMTGPRQAEPGYDYILQGLAGWMSITGEPDGPPAKSGLSLVDLSAGYVAAIAVLAGLHAARRDGVGMDCDVSLFDVALAMLNYPATWYLMGGLEPRRMPNSAHPSVVPFQNFATADGWIVVGCAKEKFWTRLTACIGRPDLAQDERFASFAQRRAHAHELLPILEEIFLSQPTAHWIELLAGAGVPNGPINSIPQALTDPQAVARGAVVETDHPRFGVVRQPAGAVRVGNEKIPHRRAPLRHEDAPSVLSELLGYGPEQVAALERDGAFGAAPAPAPTTTERSR